MTVAGKRMVLGCILDSFGSHPAAWLASAKGRDCATDVSHYAGLAQQAERAGFDLLFFADSPGVGDGPMDKLGRSPKGLNRLEPLTLLGALAVLTRRIGLVATASTSYAEPYNVARMFASLDHMSGGRVGWNAVTTASTSSSRNFGRDGAALHAQRYERAEEFVDVVTGLWDGWDRDALPEDRSRGFYVDPAKVHALNHVGKYFSVQGPLNIARPPQGRPVIAQAGGSDAGRELAARTADMVFTVEPSLETAVDSYRDLHVRMQRHGRLPGCLKVLHGVTVVVGDSATADAKMMALSRLIHEDVGRAAVSNLVGFDVSDIGWDDTLPAERFPDDTNRSKSYFTAIRKMAVEERRTLREISYQFALARVGNVVQGSPAEIADELETWVTSKACDGFMIRSMAFPDSFTDFCDLVMPELRRRGLVADGHDGETLRDRLGLVGLPMRPASELENRGSDRPVTHRARGA